MTRSTLLAGMGFRDPDRKSDMHDKVCRMWFENPRLLLFEAMNHDPARAAPLNQGACDFGAELEFPVKSHRGGAVLGFLDALVTYTVPSCHSEWGFGTSVAWPESGEIDPVGVRHRGVRTKGLRDHGHPASRSECLHTVLVEVKSGKVDLGAWLRQLRLYGEAVPADYRVLSSVQPVDEGDRRIFASIGWSVHDAASLAQGLL